MLRKILIGSNFLAMISLVAVLGFTSCVGAFSKSYKYVDDPLKPYVTEYHNLVNIYCPKLSINPHYSITLKDKLNGKKWVGVCTRYANKRWNIQIKRSFWETVDVNTRTQLMYHELAHCVINREHEPDLLGHYMFPRIEYVPRELFIQQAIDDIEDYCKKI